MSVSRWIRHIRLGRCCMKRYVTLRGTGYDVAISYPVGWEAAVARTAINIHSFSFILYTYKQQTTPQ